MTFSCKNKWTCTPTLINLGGAWYDKEKYTYSCLIPCFRQMYVHTNHKHSHKHATLAFGNL